MGFEESEFNEIALTVPRGDPPPYELPEKRKSKDVSSINTLIIVHVNY